MDTLEITIQAESIERLFALAEERVRSIVGPETTVRFSSVTIIAVGDEGHVDGEFSYEIPGGPIDSE